MLLSKDSYTILGGKKCVKYVAAWGGQLGSIISFYLNVFVLFGYSKNFLVKK